MSHLDQLETKSAVPLTIEGRELIFFVERWSEKLLTPEGSVSLLGSIPQTFNVLVSNDLLVKTSQVEGPDFQLIKSMINDWCVRVRRVSVDTFSLHIIEVQLLIVVFHWDGLGVSNCGSFLGIELLQTLPVVIVDHAHIIDIVVEIWVLLNALMESLEGVVEIWLLHYSMNDGVKSHVHTVTNVVIVVLHLIVVDARCLISSIEAFK